MAIADLRASHNLLRLALRPALDEVNVAPEDSLALSTIGLNIDRISRCEEELRECYDVLSISKRVTPSERYFNIDETGSVVEVSHEDWTGVDDDRPSVVE